MFITIENRTVPGMKNILSKEDFQDEDDKFVGDHVIHKNFVRSNIDAFTFELKSRAECHDNSKMKFPEYEGYKELYKELEGVEYGTPEYEEIRNRYRDVINHHYQENDHHPEHYPNGINGMDLYSLVEMYCDWKAASRRSDTDFEESIEKNIKKFNISDPLANILRNTAKFDLGRK